MKKLVLSSPHVPSITYTCKVRLFRDSDFISVSFQVSYTDTNSNTNSKSNSNTNTKSNSNVDVIQL